MATGIVALQLRGTSLMCGSQQSTESLVYPSISFFSTALGALDKMQGGVSVQNNLVQNKKAAAKAFSFANSGNAAAIYSAEPRIVWDWTNAKEVESLPAELRPFPFPRDGPALQRIREVRDLNIPPATLYTVAMTPQSTSEGRSLQHEWWQGHLLFVCLIQTSAAQQMDL